MGLLFPVILGSVRRDRQGIKAARYIIDKLAARGHEPVLVDPCEKVLPLLDRMYKEYPKGEAPPLLEELAGLFAAQTASSSSARNTTSPCPRR